MDPAAAAGSLLAHSIDPLDRTVRTADGVVHTRLLPGPAGPVPVTVVPGPTGVLLRTDATDPAVLAALRATVARWFDLDADLDPVDAHLRRSPVLAAQVRERPGLRITRYPAAFEAATLIVLGQQVSLAAGRLFGRRLLAAHGGAAVAAPGGPLRPFPAPERLALVEPEALREELGLTRSRTRTVLEIAALFADLRGREPSPAELGAVHGVGPWPLACAAIRAGTEVDAFPTSDAVLRRSVTATGVADETAAIASWSPYRSYAAARLWAGSGAHPA